MRPTQSSIGPEIDEGAEEIEYIHMVIEVDVNDLMEVLEVINSQISASFTIRPLNNKYRIEFQYY